MAVICTITIAEKYGTLKPGVFVYRIIRDDVELWVPDDANNSDYQDLMEQVAEGCVTITDMTGS